MRQITRWRLLAFACAVFGLMRIAIPGNCQKSYLPGREVPSGFGVNIHFTDATPLEMQKLADSGVKFIRMDFSWQGCESKPGAYDFSAYDRLTRMLDAHGIRPLYILDYQNSNYDNNQSPYTGAGRQAFARFAAAAADHFRGRGVVWEIWNEPNGGFWVPKPNADDYASLAIAACVAIRKADPGACIVAPASSGFPWSYFETLFNRGLLKYIDAVSVHPYRQLKPETVDSDYTRLRKLIAQYTDPGDRQIPIVSSEWGYSTSWDGLTEQKQGNYIVREWLTNLAYGVNLSIYYDWKNDGTDPKNAEHNFGTQTSTLIPKPAYLAAKALNESLSGYKFAHRLVGASPDNWKLLFVRGSHIALVTWNASETATDHDAEPTVTYILPSQSQYPGLLRTADIAFASDVLTPTLQKPSVLTVDVKNVEANAAKVKLVINGETRSLLLKSKQESEVSFPIPYSTSDSDSELDYPVSATWNGAEVTDLPAARVAPVNPLEVTSAPKSDGIDITVENLQRQLVVGTATITQGISIWKQSVRINAGEASSVSFPAAPFLPFNITIDNSSGQELYRRTDIRYIPFKDFPAGASDITDLQSIPYPNNAQGTPTAAIVTPLTGDSPGPVGVIMNYTTATSWLYTNLHPTTNTEIPTGAKYFLVWVRATGDNVPLRARFIDSTGQCFQPDMGTLSWKGWRTVRIPLFGDMAHWGGANDGVPHGPLKWDSIILVDGTNLPVEKTAITVAMPAYEIATTNR
jgi:hypothetical protein